MSSAILLIWSNGLNLSALSIFCQVILSWCESELATPASGSARILIQRDDCADAVKATSGCQSSVVARAVMTRRSLKTGALSARAQRCARNQPRSVSAMAALGHRQQPAEQLWLLGGTY